MHKFPGPPPLFHSSCLSLSLSLPLPLPLSFGRGNGGRCPFSDHNNIFCGEMKEMERSSLFLGEYCGVLFSNQKQVLLVHSAHFTGKNEI